MLRLTNLKAPLDYTEASLRTLLLKKLKLAPDQLRSFHISRRSIDTRDMSILFSPSISLVQMSRTPCAGTKTFH